MLSQKNDIPSGLGKNIKIYNHFTPTEFWVRQNDYTPKKIFCPLLCANAHEF